MEESAVIALILVPGLAVLAVTTSWVTKVNAREGAVPSDWAGLRTRATKASPEAWVRGHQAAVPVAMVMARGSLVTGGAVVVLASGSLAIVPLAVLALVVGVVGFLAAIGGCVYACLVADQAARTHP